MGFLSQLVSTIGVFECTFVMPVCRRVVAFFIVLGGSAVRTSGQFVLLSGFTM